MAKKSLYALVCGLCAAISVAFACPGGGGQGMIQCPSTDQEVDPMVGPGTMWAIVPVLDPCTWDPWYRGDDNFGFPIYCRYKFKLVNVTDNVTIECSNHALPSPRHVVYDTTDQWSWGRPDVNWEYGKTYRLELWQDADPSDPTST